MRGGAAVCVFVKSNPTQQQPNMKTAIKILAAAAILTIASCEGLRVGATYTTEDSNGNPITFTVEKAK